MLIFSLLAAGVTTPAAATRKPAKTAKTANQGARGMRALAEGTFVEGPRHTWGEIRKRPGEYVAMVLGLGVAGAVLKSKGIDPEPYALSLSGGVWMWSLKEALPEIRRTRGVERMRAIGANVVWTLGIMVGTGVAGHQIHSAGPQTIVITSDIPTVLHHGKGHKRKAKAGKK